MHRYTIKRLLNIPEYKIVKVSVKREHINIWLEPFKEIKRDAQDVGNTTQKGIIAQSG